MIEKEKNSIDEIMPALSTETQRSLVRTVDIDFISKEFRPGGPIISFQYNKHDLLNII